MFTLIILASVPFVGNVQNGRLLCNAPCEVIQNGQVVASYDGPVITPFDGPAIVRPRQ